PHERIQAVTEAITRAFKAKDFDRGLRDAVALIASDAGQTPRGVRDAAGLFSSEAVRKADAEIETITRRSKQQVVIETVASIGDRLIESEAIDRAKSRNVHGLYILISKQPHKLGIVPSESANRVFRPARVEAISSAMLKAFRGGQYDKGLLDG